VDDRALAEIGLDPELIPQHIGVIMDGNGRWARSRGLPRVAGHRAGAKALRRLIEASIEFRVPMVTIYAFSTENWKRPAHEVRALMFLLEDVIENQLDELDENGIRLRHIGWLDGITERRARAIREAVQRTAHNDRLALNVAFNYGARGEIVRAVQAIVREGVPADEIDEACIEAHLQTAGLPDPDMIIRTSGEMRLSNFLLWQAAYAEFYCTETYWPDFDRDTLLQALLSFAERERRFGRVGAPTDGRTADGSPSGGTETEQGVDA
jgi:undecaprenyl diphosphate synthase